MGYAKSSDLPQWCEILLDCFSSFKEKEKCSWELECDRELFFQPHLSLLERDIDEVRKTYNIGVPVVYKQFVEEFGTVGESRLDTFHPQYKDVDWDTAELTI